MELLARDVTLLWIVLLRCLLLARTEEGMLNLYTLAGPLHATLQKALFSIGPILLLTLGTV